MQRFKLYRYHFVMGLKINSLWLVFVLNSIAAINTYAQTRNIYISNQGDDNNSGLLAQMPIQSVSKLNSLMLKPGDKVLFARGQTFYGQIIIKSSGTAASPIIFDSYGAGVAPTINGAQPLTNWKNTGIKNLWQTAYINNTNHLPALYQNTKALPLGRYPNPGDFNQGFLTIKNHTGKNTLTAQQNLPLNLTGGELADKPNQWSMDRSEIMDQQGNTLTTKGKVFDFTDNWGFFIQNLPFTLDIEGEWCNEEQKHLISIYTASNPNLNKINIAVCLAGITINNASNIIIQNLNITHMLSYGIYAINSSDITITHVTVNNCAEDGITFNGRGNNIQFQYNWLNNLGSNGITLQNYGNVNCSDNIIKNIGLVAGMVKGGDNQNYGIELNSDAGDAKIFNNVLDSLGYMGILFKANNVTVAYNKISNYALLASDGGGIYVWNGAKPGHYTNINIISNIVSDAKGNYAGVYKPYPGAYGIYLDDLVEHVTVKNNTVFNCASIGIFLHGVNNCTINNNTCFNNGIQFSIINSSYGKSYNNTVQNNILACGSANQHSAVYKIPIETIEGYGVFNNNYYLNPYNPAETIGWLGDMNHNLYLSDWQNDFKQDINSAASSVNPYNLKPSKINSAKLIFATNKWTGYGDGNVGDAVFNNNTVTLRAPAAFKHNRVYDYVHANSDVIAVDKDAKYVLSFDMIGIVKNKALELFIKNSKPPNEMISPEKITVPITTLKTHYNIELKNMPAKSDVNIVFNMRYDARQVTISNISFTQATDTGVKAANKYQLFYNATKTNMVVNLNGNYHNVIGRQYAGSLTLAPFTAMLLTKNQF